MKKLFFSLIVLLSFGLSVIADDVIYSKPYITKFYHCMPVKNSYKLGDDNVTTSLSGWKDEKCRYSMTATSKNGEQKTYECKFTRDQLTEFTQAIKVDPQGTGDSKKLLDKYLIDRNICGAAD